MRINRSLILIATFVLVFLITAAGSASAAETWVTDIKSGAKIGWVSNSSAVLTSATWNGPIVNGKAQGKGSFTIIIHQQDGSNPVGEGEGEMLAGLLNGKGAIRWSYGESYEGVYAKGLLNGKGTYKSTSGNSYDGEWLNGELSGKGIFKWKDGRVYEGEFLKGLMHGQGVMKDANGKILQEGEWKEGKPVTVGLKTDNVLGIPWGASEKTVKSTMSQRPGTKFLGNNKRNDATQLSYTTTFNGILATTEIFSLKDQMYWVRVVLESKTGDEALKQYADFKQGLIDRYAMPTEEKGNAFEAYTKWALGDEHFLALAMGKNQTGNQPPVPIVCLDYLYKPTFDLIEGIETTKNTSDF